MQCGITTELRLTIRRYDLHTTPYPLIHLFHAQSYHPSGYERYPGFPRDKITDDVICMLTRQVAVIYMA